ncbi:hypothetical protein P9391_25420, partial [Klebsiella pneumoniae]
KIGPDPRNFNQRVSLGRNDLLIRTFLRVKKGSRSISSSITMSRSIYSPVARAGVNRFGCTFCQQTVQANLLRLK